MRAPRRCAGLPAVWAALGPSVALATATLVLAAPSAAQQPGSMDATTVSEIGGWTEAEEGEGLAFGVAVFNPEGGTLDFEWDLGDGSDPVGGPGRRAVTHRYGEDGDYTVRLRVSGSQGFSASRRVDVRIEAAPPTVEALSWEEPARPGRPVAFEASATDPGDDDLTYVWDFGDGSSPVSGLDRTELEHTFGEPGTYTVTLSVRDEDGLEDRRSARIEVNPGFLGALDGDVSTPVAGVTGRPALTNALPGGPALPLGPTQLFTGAIPMVGGIADMGEEHGVCLVVGGFWDDEHEVHVNFLWVPDRDSIFVPKTYPIHWDVGEGAIEPGQTMVNALVLRIDPSYEDTKDGAENMQAFEPGMEGLLSNLGSVLSGFLGGGRPAASPGRNHQANSRSGFLRIRRVTREWISGTMDVALRGAWMSLDPEGSGESSLRLGGSFVWELDDVARANLLRCGEQPFTIESHTPRAEEINVDFTLPEISLTFTRQVLGETVNDGTFRVGYLDESLQFVPIDGTVLLDGDGRTVRFAPDDDLLDAVFYHVRVTGGEGGVRSVEDETLPEDYEWRFITVVDLLPSR